MKKLIATILILALLLPAAVLAEDPIVGQWYCLFDFEKNSELASLAPGYARVIDVYFFASDGTISCLEGSVMADGSITANFTPAGKWSKDGNKYSFVTA